MNTEKNFTPIGDSNLEKKAQPTGTFSYEQREQPVSFIETMNVADGVECDVYTFVEDESKDLGIIKIGAEKKTPLQKVLKGEKTIEGYMSGKGKLTIVKADGKKDVFVANGAPLTVTVNIGELMQWEADTNSNLEAFEICFPPYEEGRFENIG